MPLVTPFETSFGRTTLRRILLAEADVDGCIGWGECVAGEGPFYAPERGDGVARCCGICVAGAAGKGIRRSERGLATAGRDSRP